MPARLQRLLRASQRLHARQPVKARCCEPQVEEALGQGGILELRNLDRQPAIARGLFPHLLRQSPIRLDRQQITHRGRQHWQRGMPSPCADLETVAPCIQAAPLAQPVEQGRRIAWPRAIILFGIAAEFRPAGR